MQKTDLSYFIGVLRQGIVEKLKVNVNDVKLIVEKLGLLSLSDDAVGLIRNEISEFILNKIRYFERKGNKLKIEEYQKIHKRTESVFEFFLTHKSELYPKSQ